MFIARRFTAASPGLPYEPYAGINFVERPVTRRTPGGPVKLTVTVPDDWDQTAVDVMATKYMRRGGVPVAASLLAVPEEGVPEWLWRRAVQGQMIEEPHGETDARRVFNRLAGCWTYWGWKLGYFSAPSGPVDGDTLGLTAEDSARAFYDETRHVLAARLFSPNSPQWFNTGLHWAYGITAPDSGQWAIAFRQVGKQAPHDIGVEPAGLSYVRPAANACFILGVKDTLLGKGGIYDTLEREARIFKFGGGAGANFSGLRGEGEPLSGGGFSSGMMSFLNTLDAGAGSIKSGGVTRRAAKMVCVNDDHPDVEEFVTWKAREEYRAACTVTGDRVYRDGRSGRMGTSLSADINHPWVTRRAEEARRMGFEAFPEEPFNDHFEGKQSAYQGCQGQNANNSVRVSNKFMDAVKWGHEWQLKRRTDGGVAKVIQARDLWQKITRAAWLCADPGLQFDDLWNDWNLCPEDGRINATNPCSEYGWHDDTACNLGSVRLTKFATRGDGGQITGLNVGDFEWTCGLATIALDITVSMAGYPSEEIAEGSRKYRTIGLGYCDLGAFLMQAGHAYDSDGGRAWAAALTSLMHSAATHQSAVLARDVGTFPQFQKNRKHCLRVIGNHARWGVRVAGYAAKDYDGLSVTPPDVQARGVVPQEVLDAVSTQATTAAAMAEHHGLRNAQLTLIAPTGTIGLQLGCDTTGIEPDFALVKDKKLVGGGYFKIVNQGLPAALAALNYDAEAVQEVTRYVFGTRTVQGVGGLAARLSGALSDAELAALDAALKGANTIDQALMQSVHTSLRWAKILFCDPAVAEDPEFKPLKSLLWRQNPEWDAAAVLAEAAELEADVMGTGTVEGAPRLHPADYAVFDCATPSGQGKRSIEWMGHIRMMAAAQPALSGGISKTVNMPADATPDQVSDAYRAAHQRMVKCVALYLDGSKLSQPLNAVRGDAAADLSGVFVPEGAAGRVQVSVGRHLSMSEMTPAEDIFAMHGEAAPEPAPADAYEDDPEDNHHTEEFTSYGTTAEPARGREKLPDRRYGYTQKLHVGRQKVYMRTGEYPDGRLGEIFLDVADQGSDYRAVGNAFAVAVSLGLQHGVPLDEFVDAFVGLKFEPSGVVRGHDRIKMGSSVLDAVFRDLAITYLKRDELAHVQLEEADSDPPLTTAATDVPPEFKPLWKVSPFTNPIGKYDPATGKVKKVGKDTGGACPECHNFSLRQTGTCKQCTKCFWHSGCG